MSVTSADVSDLHPALRLILEELVRDEDGNVMSGPNWVEFLSDDADIDAEIKGGSGDVLRIDARLLMTKDGAPSANEVFDWIAEQPKPTLGVLTVVSVESEGGIDTFHPSLGFEVLIDSLVPAFIGENIAPFADAWDDRTVAEVPSIDATAYRQEPIAVAPRNAWLFMGDEASYPTPEDLAEMAAEGAGGVVDTLWTAPKNGEVGDLAVMYFIAPTTAACFVARIGGRPFWDDEIGVNAVKVVERFQWWTYLTPLIEIEPIPFKTLQQTHDGHLILKGKSGHYLKPRSIAQLTFVAKDATQQAALDLVVRTPIGNPDLPDPGFMTFEQWTQIPAGALPLEVKVSEHLVVPLPRFIQDSRRWIAGDLNLIPEHRVPAGSVDFVLALGDVTLAAIEVKLAVKRAVSGDWNDSPDFRQLRRYMDDLDVGGMLIDAHSILLVRPEAAAPFMELVRSTSTQADMAAIIDFLFSDLRGDPIRVPTAVVRRPRKRMFDDDEVHTLFPASETSTVLVPGPED